MPEVTPQAAFPAYPRIDFSNRLNALREVGQALGLAANLIPDRKSANSQRTYLGVINRYRAAQSLPLLRGLDYHDFVPALNALAVLGVTRPISSIAPSLSSNATPPIVGSVLTTNPGTWTNAPTSFTYSWQRDGNNISGVAATHTIIAADTGGHYLTCTVTAVNASGNSTPLTTNAIFVP